MPSPRPEKTPEHREAWGVVVEDICGLHHIEVSVGNGEPPYPAMVSIEAEGGGSVVADDARRYALALLAAAEVADQRTHAAFEAAGYPREVYR